MSFNPTSVKTWSVAVALLAALATGACERPAPTPPPAPPRVVWDLSQDQSTARVAWPADVHGHLWLVPGPLTVELVIPGEPPATYAVHHAQVRRQGGNVGSVSLMFPNESLDATYARAKRLAADWNITDLQALDEWYAAMQRDGRRNPDLARIHGAKAGVRVGPSFDATRKGPWYAALVVGFPENRPSPISAPGSEAR